MGTAPARTTWSSVTSAEPRSQVADFSHLMQMHDLSLVQGGQVRPRYERATLSANPDLSVV